MNTKMHFQTYKNHLKILAAQVEHPQHGFFGPRSMAWKVNREGVIAMGALRALLMQVAHPMVAQGVAEHSDFRRKPLRRVYKTLHAQQTIVFGNVEQAVESLLQVYARHATVSGSVPYLSEGAKYQANDPLLQIWVHATLVDSVMRVYNIYLPPLSSQEQSQFYRESRLFAQLMGISCEIIPETLEEFNCWIDEIMASDEIRVTPAGQEIAKSLLRMPLSIFWPTNYLLATGSLPPKLRDEYGLKWTPVMGKMYDLGVGMVGAIVRRLPLFLRVTPIYWRAMRRSGQL